MLTGKQRSYLKGLAHNERPMLQIGKEGISEGVIAQLDALLERHELVKVHVLDNSLEDAKEAANALAEPLKAEFVQAIGSKFTLYRQSRENPMIIIPGGDNTRVYKNLKKKEVSGKKEERLSKRGGKISKPGKGKRIKKERQTSSKRNG